MHPRLHFTNICPFFSKPKVAPNRFFLIRLTGLDNGGDTSQTPLSTTPSTNDEVEVLISSRPRVYHHKVQIAGRSQSPPAYVTGGEKSNDSNEPRYSPGPSGDFDGTRMGLGMASSRCEFSIFSLRKINLFGEREVQR